MKSRQKTSPFVACAIGVCLLVYLWKTLGDRGLAADMNGAAGYTTPFEIALGAVALILILGSVIVIFRRYR